MKQCHLFVLLTLVMGSLPGICFGQGANQAIQDELLGITDETKLHGSISTSAFNNQDEYSDGFWSVRTQLSYELDDDLQAYVDWSYLSPFTSAEEEVRRFGVRNLSVGLTKDLFGKRYGSGLSFSLLGIAEVTAPLSETAQNAGMRGGTAAGLLTNSVYSKFIFSTSHFAIYENYEFETANAEGTEVNNPYWIINGANLTWLTTRKFNIRGGYSYWYSQNFAGTETPIQSISGAMTFIPTRDFAFSIFMLWRDRLITNNDMFDDDTTRTGASIRYIF